MKINYQLKEADLIALAKFQLEEEDYIAKMTRRRRVLFTIGFGLMAVGTWLVYGDSFLVYVFVFLAVFAFVVSPFASRHVANRILPRIVKSRLGKTSLGSKTLIASSDELVYGSEEAQSKAKWSIVSGVAETNTYVFIEIDGTYSIVIPKSEVDADNLGSFLDEVRTRTHLDDA